MVLLHHVLQLHHVLLLQNLQIRYQDVRLKGRQFSKWREVTRQLIPKIYRSAHCFCVGTCACVCVLAHALCMSLCNVHVSACMCVCLYDRVSM